MRLRLNDWVVRHATAVLVVIVCGGLSLAFRADHIDRVQREADRTESARGYVNVLRQSCEDRNERDSRILAGVKVIAADLDADPDTVKPISDALAPRDCNTTYPMPKAGEIIPIRTEPGTTLLPGRPFDTCAEAAAAGLVPLERSDPGYSPTLDDDGDGVACE